MVSKVPTAILSSSVKPSSSLGTRPTLQITETMSRPCALKNRSTTAASLRNPRQKARPIFR